MSWYATGLLLMKKNMYTLCTRISLSAAEISDCCPLGTAGMTEEARRVGSVLWYSSGNGGDISLADLGCHGSRN